MWRSYASIFCYSAEQPFIKYSRFYAGICFLVQHYAGGVYAQSTENGVYDQAAQVAFYGLGLRVLSFIPELLAGGVRKEGTARFCCSSYPVPQHRAGYWVAHAFSLLSDGLFLAAMIVVLASGMGASVDHFNVSDILNLDLAQQDVVMPLLLVGYLLLMIKHAINFFAVDYPTRQGCCERFGHASSAEKYAYFFAVLGEFLSVGVLSAVIDNGQAGFVHQQVKVRTSSWPPRYANKVNAAMGFFSGVAATLYTFSTFLFLLSAVLTRYAGGADAELARLGARGRSRAYWERKDNRDIPAPRVRGDSQRGGNQPDLRPGQTNRSPVISINSDHGANSLAAITFAAGSRQPAASTSAHVPEGATKDNDGSDGLDVPFLL